MRVKGLPELAIVLGLGLGDHAGGSHGCGAGRRGRLAAAFAALGFSEFGCFAPLCSGEE